MHVSLDPTSRAPNPVRRIPAVLEQLYRDDVDLVSWHRELPAGLDEQLMEWTRLFPAHFDEVLTMPNCDLSPATHGLADPAREWLTTDVASALACLAQVADARRLRVSLGAVRTDQCRKFHVDYVRYRLVTTYLGPGTEWVPAYAVRREAFAEPMDCPLAANQAIVRDSTAVRHAAPGEVLLMKGARHSNHGGTVHRSPPIEGTGRVRVVLVASTVEDS